DGPPRFPPDCTCPAVLGCLFARALPFVYRAVTVFGRPFQDRSTRSSFGNSLEPCWAPEEIPRPRFSNASTLALNRFRHCPRSLATTRGIAICFLFLRLLRCFSSPGWLPDGYEFTVRLAGSPCAGCPIRISPDHCLLAASRGFSQLSTSFFASHRLGIHR